MALNPEFVGRTYAPTEVFEVTAESITEFAQALHMNPVADVTGFLVAPPTFPIAFTLTAAEALGRDPELGLDWSRVVHGEQSFAYERALRAGDRVEVTSTIDSIKSMAGNDILIVRGEVRTVDGEHVASCSSMLVVRGDD